MVQFNPALISPCPMGSLSYISVPDFFASSTKSVENYKELFKLNSTQKLLYLNCGKTKKNYIATYNEEQLKNKKKPKIIKKKLLNS